jgi:catechol 2,3-dioxygenase-like lactoylglutathione lyase family enzyme
MALHGLGSITLGVPDVAAASAFYRDFGLEDLGAGRFASADGGEQLRLVHTPYRRLVEFCVAASDEDDLARVAGAAQRHGIAVDRDEDGSIAMTEPVVGIRARVAVRERVVEQPAISRAMNAPGSTVRPGERAPAIFDTGPARPRRLGHALYTTSDLDASQRFLVDVLGFRLSDTTPGIISFLRCSTDHHNIGLINAPVPFFHHSSWAVNDLDEIGRGAHSLLAVDPTRHVWGLGRHFLGSNLFWYFRDPAGNYTEYFADLDQIVDDAAWIAREWDPSKALYAWGPPVPADFVVPGDVDEIAAAIERNGAVAPSASPVSR